MLGTAAASAQSYRGGHNYNDRSYHQDYRGGNSYRGGNGYRGGNDYRGGGWNSNRSEGAGLIGLGFGLMALAAIASSHNQPDYRYQNGGYYGR